MCTVCSTFHLLVVYFLRFTMQSKRRDHTRVPQEKWETLLFVSASMSIRPVRGGSPQQGSVSGLGTGLGFSRHTAMF